MAIRPGVSKRCRYCRSPLDATTVRRATVSRDGIIAVIFLRTIPVLLCPTCDTAPQGPRSEVLLGPTR